MRACRVGEWTKNVEDRTLPDLLARTDGVPHRRVELRREHESNTKLIDCLGDLLRRQIQVDTEGREDIRRAAMRRLSAVAMLGNLTSRPRQDKCRRSGNIERVRAVTAGADDIVDGFI